MLCLKLLFSFICFRQFERILEPSCPLQILSSLFYPFIESKTSKPLPSLPQLELCKNLASSPSPKLSFPFFQQKTPKNHSNSLIDIPSLKLALISVISRPIDTFLLRLTQREPSPVLVGLATRLSVFWCYPESRLASA